MVQLLSGTKVNFTPYKGIHLHHYDYVGKGLEFHFLQSILAMRQMILPYLMIMMMHKE